MAKAGRTKRAAGTTPRKTAQSRAPKGAWQVRRVLRRGVQALALVPVVVLLLVVLFRFVNPPTTFTMWSESRRLDGVARDWAPADYIAPVMLRSVVAAEDANFCVHWGFDMAAIRDAIEDGSGRGASTISQQVAKNVFLWQGRSWVRKAFEAVLTPLIEVFWPKRRILEVYLNVAEFGEGVFGVEAAAQHHFGVAAADLSARQAARLAVLLPNPKERDPNKLSQALQRRAAQIAGGAETIRADGRAACFES